jgi:very-short-patch-repair endonuclease
VTPESEIALFARRQHGMVTWEQMRAAGVSRRGIASHLESGWIVRRHGGVYQLGPFPGPFGPEHAAILACGSRGILSCWTAAAMHVNWPRPHSVDIAFTNGLAGQRPGIRPHRAADLLLGDVVVRHGLRVTSPARTLLDLAAVAPRDVLERLVEEAQVQNLVSTAELVAMGRRGAGKRGIRAFREIVDLLDEPLFTRSEAERRLLALCRKARLPLPQTNVRRAGWEVDAVWESQRLVVEVDGHRYHRTRAKFERDRRKDADLMLAGYRVLRLTWHRLTREPAEVVALLGAALHLRDPAQAP